MYVYDVKSTPQAYPAPITEMAAASSEPIPRGFMGNDDAWDEEPPAEAYNPRKYCKNSDVIRKAFGTPAQRKAFRQAEVERKKSLK
jgi:hypothetical protein